MVVRLVFVDFWGTLFKLEVPVDKYLDERSILFKKVLHNFGYNFSVEFLKERYQIVRTVVDSVRRALSLEVPLLVEIRSLVKVLGIDDNYEIERALVKVYEGLIVKYLKPVSDAEYFLSELKKMNLLLVLVSNTSDSKILRLVLRRYHLNMYFDFMVFSDRVMYRKPHKIIYKKVLRKFYVKPSECIMIGDEDVDSIGARSLGIISISLNSNVEADYNVNNLREAYHLIVNLLGK
ncbi:MAG: HAD family hydrolase [Thermoprotei archaeon]|jgi:putative hydrolase of the HAD superfamily